MEHQKELEREEELKKAKKKEQDLLNQKMKKDLEDSTLDYNYLKYLDFKR